MNNKLDRFLLGTLWLVAVVLCACFWFNVRFGFDLLRASHWQYLSDAQVGPASITIWFYLSLVIFFLIAIIGIYLLLQTKKTPPDNKPNNTGTSNFVEPISDKLTIGAPTDTTENIARPPKPTTSTIIQMPNVTTSPAPTLNLNIKPPANVTKPETRNAVQQIVERAGYLLKKGPVINGLNFDVWALGTNETMLIGIICSVPGEITAVEGGMSKWKSSTGDQFDSPVWQLVGATNKLQTLFTETLDEIAINTRPFVIMDGGTIINRDKVQSIWDAFDCYVFNNVSEFQEFMQNNPNAPLDQDEQENFDAYVDYMNTVAQHFNNNN